MAHRETYRIQGSEVPRVRFDRIEQNLIRRRDTEWSSGGSVFQSSRAEGRDRLQRWPTALACLRRGASYVKLRFFTKLEMFGLYVG